MTVKTNFQFVGAYGRVFTKEYVDPSGAYGRDAVGNVFFVCNGYTVNGVQLSADSPGNGFSPEGPFNSTSFALTQCQANNGDCIFLLPGNSESISTLGGVSVNVAGVSIIGLTGNGNTRPNYVFTGAAASFNVAAPGLWVENVVFNDDSVGSCTTPISVAAADATFLNCLHNTDNSTNQATCAIRTTAGATNLTIQHNQFMGSASAAANTAVLIVGGSQIAIRDCDFQGAYGSSTGAINNVTTATTNLIIDNCRINNATASSTKAITAVAGTTGMLTNSRLGILSGVLPITAAGLTWAGGNSSVGAPGVVATAF